jgi:uncharacterized protein
MAPAMEPVRYEWDEAKRLRNLETHGVDLAAASGFSWGKAIIVRDERRPYGERRFVAYGPIGGRLHALVYTPRNMVRRLISLRKANRREQAAYAAETARVRGEPRG